MLVDRVVDASICREWVMNVGCRDARAKLAVPKNPIDSDNALPFSLSDPSGNAVGFPAAFPFGKG